MTPKQLFEEKLRRQKLQEEADLALAVEAFGIQLISYIMLNVVE